jgi:hypothetical protein
VINFKAEEPSLQGEISFHYDSSQENLPLAWPVPSYSALESRELADLLSPIDAALVDNRWNEALNRLNTAGIYPDVSPAIKRRLAFLQSSMLCAPVLADVPELMLSSLRVSQAYERGCMETTARELVCLGRALQQRLPAFDGSALFDHLFSELLGDTLTASDPTRALELYRRASPASRENVILHAKIAALGVTMRRPDVEVEALMAFRTSRLARRGNADRHVTTLLQAHLELENRWEHCLTISLDIFRQAGQHDETTLITAIDLLIDALREHGGLTRAIAILEDLAVSPRLLNRPLARAYAHDRLATLWLNHFGRPEMAELHAREAVEIDPRRASSHLVLVEALRLRAAPATATVAQARAALARLLNAQVHDGVPTLTRVLTELHMQEGIPRAGELLQLLIGASSLASPDPNLLGDLEARAESTTRWTQIYQGLQRIIASEKDAERLGRFSLLAGIIAENRLRRLNAANEHYAEAFPTGVLPLEKLATLADYLETMGRAHTLSAVLDELLEHVPSGQDRLQLLRRASRIPNCLAEGRMDAIALELSIDWDEDTFLVSRVDHHIRSKHGAAIIAIATAFLRSPLPSERKISWLKTLGPLFDERPEPALSGNIAAIFENAASVLGFHADIHIAAISALGEPAGDFLRPHLTALLDRAILPPVSVNTAQSVLSKGELTRFLTLKARASSDPSESRQLAEKALEVAAPEKHLILEALLTLCHVTPLTSERLAYLVSLARELQRVGELLDALTAQADLTNANESRATTLDLAASLSAESDRDFTRASDYYQRAWATRREESDFALGLARLASICGNASAELRAWKQFVAAPQSLSKPELLGEVLSRMTDLGGSDADVFGTGMKLVEHLLGARQYASAGQIASIITLQAPASLGVSLPLLRAVLFVDDNVSAALLTQRSLMVSENAAETRTVLRSIEDILHNASKGDLLWPLVRGALIDAPLPQESKAEVFEYIGAKLFGKPDRRRAALEIYQCFRDTVPTDTRWIVPLYYLLQEFGTRREVGRHLRANLGLLREQPSLLASEPLTVESLAAELVAIRLDTALGDSSPNLKAAEPPFQELVTAIPSAPMAIFPLVESTNVHQASRPALSWRELISGDVPPEAPATLRDQHFDCELEKHLALQVASLLSGEMDELRDWPWRVWRHPEEHLWNSKLKATHPNGPSQQLLENPLSRLVLMMTPWLKVARPDLFTVEPVARAAGLTSSQLPSKAQPLSWEAPVFVRSGISRWKDALTSRKYQAFGLTGLNTAVHLDLKRRALYLDPKCQLDAPPTTLYHRLMRQVRGAENSHHIALTLASHQQLLPALREGLARLKPNTAGRFLMDLGLPMPASSKALASIDAVAIQQLSDVIGPLDDLMLRDVLRAMETGVDRIILLESMNLVGICESLTGRNLIESPAADANELFGLSPLIRPLLQFASELEFE